MIGKHTLLIDGNFFVFSRLFTLPTAKNTKLVDDEKSCGQFMRKLAIDFCSEIRKMHSYNIIDDVVMAVDSKSWRKDFYPNLNYKGNREMSDNVNWDNVFSIYKQFQAILEECGVKIEKVEGAEGDDIVFQWSVNLNNNGKNTIVWSGDKDLIQLANFSPSNNAHTICYHSVKNTIYADEDFYARVQNNGYEQENKNELELLFNLEKLDSIENGENNPMLKWIEENKIKIESVYCEEYILKKILTGDKSDSIPAVVTWKKTIKNGEERTYSLTDKNANKIFDQFIKENSNIYKNKYEFKIDNIFDPNLKQHLADVIYRVMGKNGTEEIKNNLDINISLMLLHLKILPEGIINAINEQYMQSSTKILGKSGLRPLLNKNYLLANTQWLEQNESADGMQGFDIPEETNSNTNNTDNTNNKELF
jgi:5'-3' exonuclease